ncbi:MAG: hypothetical protein H7A51_08220 [Akkermansiaceae bacterium]|nr:hypothetical protein [Akkermansiaceae bacterium]
MNENDHRDNILEVLDAPADGHFKEEALNVMLGAARTHKHKRRARNAGAVAAALALVAGLGIYHQNPDSPSGPGLADATEERGKQNKPDEKVLTDAALLESFGNEPVALVGEPGNQRLIRLNEY